MTLIYQENSVQIQKKIERFAKGLRMKGGGKVSADVLAGALVGAAYNVSNQWSVIHMGDVVTANESIANDERYANRGDGDVFVVTISH